MKLYLARKRNGLYQLSGLLPIRTAIAGTDMTDIFVQPGDPVTLHGLCPFSVKALFGKELEPGEITRVRVITETIPVRVSKDRKALDPAASQPSLPINGADTTQKPNKAAA